MSPRPLTTQELDELPLGSVIADWEGDHLVNEAPGSWYYRDQPTRGNTPRAFTSEVMARAYSATLVQRAPEPEPAVPVVPAAQHTRRGSIRERARMAAREEWNRRWTLNEKPSIHTYADAVADAVVGALFPLTLGKLGEESKAAPPSPLATSAHRSLQEPVSPETQRRLEDVFLEHGGTPRHQLFEYPHNEFESKNLLKAASAAVTKVLALLQRPDQ